MLQCSKYKYVDLWIFTTSYHSKFKITSRYYNYLTYELQREMNKIAVVVFWFLNVVSNLITDPDHVAAADLYACLWVSLVSAACRGVSRWPGDCLVLIRWPAALHAAAGKCGKWAAKLSFRFLMTHSRAMGWWVRRGAISARCGA